MKPSLVRNVIPGGVTTLILVLCAIAAGAYHAAGPGAPNELAAATITLPLEVIGPNGYRVAIAVDVPNALGIEKLYVQAHNLSYEGKGSVRINGGPWVGLENDAVRCVSPEDVLGCIGGAYGTVRFTTPIAGIVTGRNTIEFRHNQRPNDNSSGWRVLAMNLLRSDGTGVLDSRTFVYDDPRQWSPPSNRPEDISAGARLFSERKRLVDAGRRPITASCGDCHASNGSDLKYFNYSNHAIVARSRFHGLSGDQGRKIASYIRSLKLRNEKGEVYDPPGTPWDPPYQPGPGLDSKPPHAWAAGAGLQWVMDSDKQVWPHMFPSGVPGSDLSTGSTINLREIPLDLQFPNWNQWLPSIHPIDAWGSSFSGHAVSQRLEELLSAADGGNALAVEKAINRLNAETRKLRNTRPAGSNDAAYAHARLSLQQWQLVKVWEAQRHFEDDAPSLHPHGEVRSWLGGARNVFDLAPHIINVNGLDRAPFLYGSAFSDNFMSHVWYHLQLIINAGNRAGSGQSPVDWNYQIQFIRKDPRPSAMRHVQTMVKLWQMRDNKHGINTASGWRIFDTRPSHIGRMFVSYAGYPRVWSEVDRSRRKQLAEGLLGAWLEKQLSYPISAWPRGYGTNLYEPRDYVPKIYKDPLFRERDHADNIYTLVWILGNEGVDSAMLSKLAAWGEQMWPRGDWDSLIRSSAANETHEQRVELKPGWNQFRFIGQEPVPLADAVGLPPTSLVMLMDEMDRAYVPDLQIDDVQDLQPGRVYRAYASAAAELTHAAGFTASDTSVPRQHEMTDPGAVDPSCVIILTAPEIEDETRVVAMGTGDLAAGSAVFLRGKAVMIVRRDQPEAREGGTTEAFTDELTLRTMSRPGRDWIQLLPTEVTNTLTGEAVDNILTCQNGSVLLVDAAEKPGDFSLGQNFPNPFNPSTNIDYTLPDESHVKLEVYDMAGRRVAILLDERQEAGYHHIEFEANELASGTYLYRLRAGAHSSIRKMLLAR